MTNDLVINTLNELNKTAIEKVSEIAIVFNMYEEVYAGLGKMDTVRRLQMTADIVCKRFDAVIDDSNKKYIRKEIVGALLIVACVASLWHSLILTFGLLAVLSIYLIRRDKEAPVLEIVSSHKARPYLYMIVYLHAKMLKCDQPFTEDYYRYFSNQYAQSTGVVIKTAYKDVEIASYEKLAKIAKNPSVIFEID